MNAGQVFEKLQLWLGLESEHTGFRKSLRRLGRRGLIAVGVIGMLVTLVFSGSKAFFTVPSLEWTLWTASASSDQVLLFDKAIIALLSVGLIAAGLRGCSLRAERLLMAATVFLAATVSLLADLARGQLSVEYITLLFAGAVVAVPFRPWETAAMGLVFSGLFYTAGVYGPRWMPGQSGIDSVLVAGELIYTIVFAVLMVGASMLLYVSRRRQYQARRRQYQARREAETLRDEVAELEAAKSRFFANVSHELRTPLTVILGPLEDALAGRYGEVPSGLEERLRAMRGQVQRLQELVNQLLQLSKLDEGRMDLEARPIDLGHVLGRMKSLFRSMADRQGVEVRVETEGRSSACADPEALKQIVSNLLSNALEHTPDGGTVRLGATPAEGQPDGETDERQVVLSVRDSGPGLPEEIQDNLFDRYVGADGESAGALDTSTGIGLAVVKELVERHGGTVAAESEAGFGTEITVTLPADCEALPDRDLAEDRESAAQAVVVETEERPPPDSPAPAALPLTDAGGRDGQDGAAERPQVLVVDDEDEVRRYLKEVLAPRYEVRGAADGEAGLRAAREKRPDLVISDVVMPRRDGYELCRAIRSDERLRGLPVVLLTVQDEQDDRLEGLKEGADAYLAKPFRPEELRQRVENLIGIRRYLQSRSGPAPSPGGAAPSGGAETSDETAPGMAEGDAAGDDAAEHTRAVGRESEFLREIRSAVEEHVDNSSFGVEWLADEVDLSTRQLQRRLQEEAGLSAAAFIRAIRLERAAELLESGEVTTVTDAAGAVGYRDASYFSQLFKEAHGRSPSELKG
ncbi:MAG: response regulator [Salinibacter sp.]